jgi:dCTP deaminase
VTVGILSGPEIRRQIELGTISIDPFVASRLNPNSYNLTLADALLTYDELILDPRKRLRTERIAIPEDGLALQPGIGYLGCTVETIFSSKFVPVVDGRSSWGRLFLSVHQTAGFCDTGFRGAITLELSTLRWPVVVRPGDEICQIRFEEVVGEVVQYRGRYQGSRGPVESRLYHGLTLPLVDQPNDERTV